MSRRYNRRVSDTAGASTIFSADFTRTGVSKLAGGAGAGTAFEVATGLRLTRASAATVQTGTSTVDSTPTNDDARFGKALDAWQTGLVLEEARTNNVAYSKPSAWPPTLATAVASGGPDGAPTSAGTITDADAVNTGYVALSVAGVNGSVYTNSTWVKDVSGAAGVSMSVGCNDGIGGNYIVSTVARPIYTSWTRVAVSGTHTAAGATSFSFVPSYAPVGAMAGYVVQKELGAFPTEAIITTGAAATRAADKLYMASGTPLITNGQVRIELSFRAKGARSSISTANTAAVFYSDGLKEVYIDKATGVVSAYVSPTLVTFPVPMTWAANDVVDVFSVLGNGYPSMYYRINGGTPISLGTASASLPAISTLTSVSILAETSVTYNLSCWLYKFAAYRDGASPSWVPPTSYIPSFKADFTGIAVSKLAGGAGAGTAFEVATGLRLTRASAATVQTGTSTVDSTPTNDDARFGKALDAWQTGLVLEEARTNVCTDTRGTSYTPESATVAATVGPDGNSAQAYTVTDADAGNTGYVQLTAPASVGQVYTEHAWYKDVSGAAGVHIGINNNDGLLVPLYVPRPVAAGWTKTTTVTGTANTAGSFVAIPAYAAGAVGAASFYGTQKELGAFATETILTTGAAATRARDRLTLVTSLPLLTPQGRLRLEFSLRPKGAPAVASTDGYHVWFSNAAATLQFVGQNAGAQPLTTVPGSSNSTFAAYSWSANDLVDLFIVIGNGYPVINYRVNGGAVTTLVGNVSQAAISSSDMTTFSFMQQSTNNYNFSCWLYKIAAYSDFSKPVWVP